MARLPQMRDVELVDEVVEQPVTPAGAGAPPDGSHPARRDVLTPARRRRAGRALAAAVVAALAGAGLDLGAEARRAERLIPFADAPGVVAPIDGVEVTWRVPATATGLPRRADDRVLAVLTEPGGPTLAALDLADGTERWRTALGPPGTGSEPYASCEVPDAREPETTERVVVCVVVEDTDTADVIGIGSVTYPMRTRLVVLDAGTGDVRSDERVAPSTTVAALGTDVLVAHIDDDDHVRLARRDPRDATEAWSFRSAEAVPHDELGRPLLTLQTDGDVVVAGTGAAGWALDADGVPLRSWAADERTDARGPAGQLLPGRGAVVRFLLVPRSSRPAEVVDLRTGTVLPLDGYPTVLSADDGSLDDVLLVDPGIGTGRVAYDLRSGEVLWAHDRTAVREAVVLDGQVLGVDRGVLRSVDGRTGETVWSADVEDAWSSAIVTDGDVVLVGSGSATVEPHLTAYGVDDGRRRWSADPAAPVLLESLDGVLYATTPDGAGVLG